MLFNSFIFLHFFFPLFLILYFLTKNIKVKNAILLVFSLLFYAWGEEELVILLILSSLVGFYSAKVISGGEKKLGLWLSLSFNLSLLFFYKYVNFFIEIINDLTGFNINEVTVALPIGISFFTFQVLSYTIDVYRGTIKPSSDYLSFASYVCMFPQLIAGPIVRYEEIEKELVGRTHSWEKVKAGSERFVIGLAKKMIIANYFGFIADDVFGSNLTQLTFYDSWLGIICYTFQIFFDFSAYSDMAIGIGMMLGFTFPENFNYPYISKSIKEFWRRWHMTMSFWFRDYVYISLGGNRVSLPKVYINLFLVFLATGLWHGASWNFIIWGLIHGCVIVLERVFPKMLKKVPSAIKWLYTILVVMIAWVFFRSKTMDDAIVYLTKMFNCQFDTLGFYRVYLLDVKFILMFCVAVTLCTPYIYKNIVEPFKIKNYISSTVYYTSLFILFLLSMAYLSTSSYDPFIYFRF